MSPRNTSESDNPFLRPTPAGRWLRRGLAAVVVLVIAGVVLSSLWYTFFHYVPPGEMLVVISKNGKPLAPGQVLADTDQKGVQKKVLGEGWHWITPIYYEAELKDDTVVEPGSVGVVTQLGGDVPQNGQILVDSDAEQGIRRQVLPPGRYRINPYGYKVESVPAVEVKAGMVGVRRRLLGKDGSSRFAVKDDEKGILRDVLQPGTYYLNPKEYEVIPYEEGIGQTSYHYNVDPKKNSAITFQARDGNVISLECTIEWEVAPTRIPDLVAEFGPLENVEPQRDRPTGAEDQPRPRLQLRRPGLPGRRETREVPGGLHQGAGKGLREGKRHRALGVHPQHRDPGGVPEAAARQADRRRNQDHNGGAPGDAGDRQPSGAGEADDRSGGAEGHGRHQVAWWPASTRSARTSRRRWRRRSRSWTPATPPRWPSSTPSGRA